MVHAGQNTRFSLKRLIRVEPRAVQVLKRLTRSSGVTRTCEAFEDLHGTFLMLNTAWAHLPSAVARAFGWQCCFTKNRFYKGSDEHVVQIRVYEFTEQARVTSRNRRTRSTSSCARIHSASKSDIAKTPSFENPNMDMLLAL